MTKMASIWLAAGVSALALAACSQAPKTTPLAGTKVDNFQLVDQNGVAFELQRNKHAKAVVLAMQVNGDAASLSAVKQLDALKAKYDGVEFALINSSPNDGRDQIVAEAKAQNIDLPILDDEQQLIGDSLGASYGGEVFLIDPKTWTVAYHGPVEAKAGGLAPALDEFLGGKPVTVADAAGKGGAIEFADRGRKAEFADISYVKDVAPILEKRCVACHQPNSIAPWYMNNYETVKAFAPMMREAIRTDRMPPFFADSHIGAFEDDENLTPDEAKTLVHWIEAGAPRGEGDDPLKTEVTARPDWPLGKPDLVVEIPKYDVPASGVVDYQTPAVANPLKEGKWLAATTFKAGERKGVHHILAGWIPKMPTGGHGGFDWNISMGGYAVGAENNTAPQGWGTYVPPGGAITFQMHYTPFGKAFTDTSKVGFYFLDKAPEKMMRQIVVVDPTIEILPNQARHHERAYVKFPAAAQIYGTQPHAHYRGYSSKLTLRTPDGQERVLLNLPRYDFSYQREYVFKDLIDIPAGSVLIADYLYDNSADNPANPDPNATIHWGDQSFEEMLFTAVRFRFADETAAHPRPDLQQALEATQFFGAIDDNIDGKLEQAELKGPMLKMLNDNFAALDADKDGGLSPPEFGKAMQMLQQSARTGDAQGGASGQP